MNNQNDERKVEHLGYMRLPEVLQLIPVCRATWWNGCKSGRFPKAYKLGPRVTGWKREDIVRCLEAFPPSK